MIAGQRERRLHDDQAPQPVERRRPPHLHPERRASFVLTTDNGSYRDYDSLVLRFDKRPSHGWSLRSSLVWTDLKGNVLRNNGYADEHRDKNGFTNIDGRIALSYSEWEFKLSGAVDLPLGIVASGQYTYLSGQYWSPYGGRPFLHRRQLLLRPQHLPHGARRRAARCAQHPRHAPRVGYEHLGPAPTRVRPRVLQRVEHRQDPHNRELLRTISNRRETTRIPIGRRIRPTARPSASSSPASSGRVSG